MKRAAVPFDILVIEDDLNLQELVVETLADNPNYSPQGVSSGPQAIQIASRVKFHLAISDVRMAGMDGITALTELKRVQPNLLTVVMTGYANEEAPLRAASIQVNDYLYKPFSLETLNTVVERTLSRKIAADKPPLLNRVLGVTQALSGWLAQRQVKQAFDRLEASRTQLFNNLFVLVRTLNVGAGTFSDVWYEAAKLEKVYFQTFLNAKTTERGAVLELAEKYETLQKTLMHRAKTKAPGGQAPPLPEHPSRPLLIQLFRDVLGDQAMPGMRDKDGPTAPPAIDENTLQLSYMVWAMNPDVRVRSPECQKLFETIWQKRTSAVMQGMASRQKPTPKFTWDAPD